MSVMAWLYGLGALSIAFPFLFHLIRRTPKGQTEFSSLMFLQPSPPTLTRRSRLENLFLLLMRCAAIGLIAFAFMRPFFRGSDTIGEAEIANRRVAILLDTSASMRRGNLWDQAKEQVETVLQKLEPGDDVSLFTFDDSVQSIVDFDDGTQSEVDRAGLIRTQLPQISPSWARSDLGGALVGISDRLDVWRDSVRADDAAAVARLQVYVISDLQKGSKTDSLQGYQWPATVHAEFLPVTAENLSNATVSLLDPIPEEDDPSFRVRVVNSERSDVEQFSVGWLDDSKAQNDEPISFHVSPGTSRVLKVDFEDVINAQEFVVSGDTEDFDNSFFVVPPEQQELIIVYLGSEDSDDAKHPYFYLKRCLIDSPQRKFKIVGPQKGAVLLDSPTDRPALVVLTEKIDSTLEQQVDRYLDSGGTLLVVLSDAEVAESTQNWTAAKPIEGSGDGGNENKNRTEYSMLAELDFSSRLLHPFSNPRFNDFTKIKFWRHCKVSVDEDKARVLARFDDDDPAIWQHDLESGATVLSMSSGWQPRASQLALSTKFVPLINSIVEIAVEVVELDQSLVVGEPIEFAEADLEVGKRMIIKPDGTKEVIEAGQTRFVGVDQPGVYRLVSAEDSSAQELGSDSELDELKTEDLKFENSKSKNPISEIENFQTASSFAVNVDRAESITAAIEIEALETLGVKVGEQKTASAELAQMRQMRDRDIENRQKTWKWLILSAIVLLIGETWLASRTESQMIAGQTNDANDLSNRLSGETS